MKLRCKDGDIAIITWDYHDCLENIGRLVEVRQPLDFEDGVAYWRIQPITPELYALHERDNTLVRESVTWASCVQHPDNWMIPIQSDDEYTSLEELEQLLQTASAEITEACAEPVEEKS